MFMYINRFLSSPLGIFALTFIFAAALTSVVFAAPPDKTGGKPGGGGSGGGSASQYVGYDVSWPQCGESLPTGPFGIVGVNGGTASKPNPCLSEQLVWANTSTGGTNQDKVQVYVNTANPGMLLDDPQYNVRETWPTNNIDPAGNVAPNPHGECDGTNSLACSWQYGWNRSVEAAQSYFVPAAEAAGITPEPSAYKWWLDVETENSWQNDYDTSPEAYQKNVATLEGMTAYYHSLGARVGIYSTNYQWGVITNDAVGADSNLNGLDSWLAGARTLKGAQSNCTLPALTGGEVVLTQYVSKGLDHNYSCIQ